MPTVTGLTPSSRDPNRLTIKVDRKAAATLPHTTIANLGLSVGDDWTPEIAAAVDEATHDDKALRFALSSLNRRAVARSKLDRKLADRDHSAGTRQRVLDHLEHLGHLDDFALAQSLIRSQTRAKPAGPRLLQQKLFQAGIAKDAADRALSEHEQHLDPDATRQQALDFAKRKLATLSRFDPATQRRRLYGTLARRGFSPDLIQDVMDRLANSPDDGA
ncbi:MAG: regulatory protein RecX [Planctomycetota bacterium]